MRVRVITALCALAAAALILWQWQAFCTLFATLLLASTIGYLITPLSRVLERHLRKAWGPPFAFLILAALTAALLGFSIPLLIRQSIALAEKLPAVWERGWDFIASLEKEALSLGLPGEQVQDFFGQLSLWAGELLSLMTDGVGGIAKSIAGSGWILLSPVIAYYMVRDRKELFTWAERMLPSRIRPIALSIASGIRDALREYVRGQVIVSLITGAITAFGLLLIGLPSWLLMGLLMAILNLIPYFGPIIGAIPILLLSGAEGLDMLIKALVVVVAAQQLESMFITPRVLGSASNLHPAIVLAGIFFGGGAAGLSGMVFALPVMLIVRVITHRLISIRLYGLKQEAPPYEDESEPDE